MTKVLGRQWTREELLAERERVRAEWKLDEREFAPTAQWRDLFTDEYLTQNWLDSISALLGER
ncbi:hypothetical protein [Curtobacterium flaccumfaciens]|uniref:hypothetical protein n=1 Tax=Curtobacterium flaccumfaciens TaxID=2035 RepID=UPI001BDFBBE6|nr:hypothetical protein [Curtobacterium flaccumfaciens]MBT1583494.1 hypothetical protein [Curtobacterium flaccumfaciens pv. flaccumfaciens]MCX2798057.1 hypothetical protein [Curtobacterium flaccumfaciens pv. flaccumfaciens]